ncbi:hypothetical protein ACLB2K_040411 [Fragaria x ananassa]
MVIVCTTCKKNLRNKYPNSIGGASFRETMVSMFNYCAYASTKEQFVEELSRFKKVGGKIAVKFLASLPNENLSNAYFPGKRYGEMCSNIAESFNSWVKEERELPIYELVDSIHLKVMKMNSERRLDADTWKGYISVEAGRHWEVVRSSMYGRHWKLLKRNCVAMQRISRSRSLKQKRVVHFNRTWTGKTATKMKAYIGVLAHRKIPIVRTT